MGRFQRRKGSKNKGEPRERTGKGYKDIVKENARYERFYREQECFDVKDFDVFLNSMRQPLPAVFRITGYKKHAKQLLKNMKKTHFEEMLTLKFSDEEEVIKPPSPLPWYPSELGWKTNLNRTQIRKAPQLQKFHAFLIAETESGHITRQEAVSMIPPLLLDVQSHHKVLDMCAAPGSKTAQIIELLHRDETNSIPEGVCVANDKDNKRCYMLVHQVSRLNSPSTLVVNHDAATFPELFIKNDDGKSRALRYDRVLCDVPCSGDGTMRKNTDVWLKWNVGNALYLHSLQLRILLRGLEVLAEGGQLVYSTCSLNPIEDEAVVAAAMFKCAGAVELVDAELPGLKWSPGVSKWRVMDKGENWYNKFTELPPKTNNIPKTMFPPEDEELGKSMHLERCMRLLPHLQDTGGFFVAVLRKTSNLPWQKAEAKVKNEKSEDCEEEATGAPPKKKPKWGSGFKEDPFVFFSEENNDLGTDIKTFYGLNDSFPVGQLLSRTSSEKKRHIYFVSELVKNVIQSNPDCLKLINTGVRAFSRSDNNQANLKCAYRIVQDGSESLEPFMDKRVVPTQMEDVKKLLQEEQPDFNTLSQQLRDKLASTDSGSMIFKYTPENEHADVECDLLMCGWKGITSARLYMCRNERMHFLNMVGHPVPEYLLPNKSSRRSRAEGNGGKDDQENGGKGDDQENGGMDQENDGKGDDQENGGTDKENGGKRDDQENGGKGDDQENDGTDQENGGIDKENGGTDKENVQTDTGNGIENGGTDKENVQTDAGNGIENGGNIKESDK